ncbi:MAG: iron-sulfur cluster assembly accessory protein [Aquificae bacterium]|nr:iron-sulfur cluster assembly accessory protein [Aquificota bacterium]
MQEGFTFKVTEKALEEIKKVAKENNIENPILRVRVVPGGCSGFQYAMGFEEKVEDEDHVFEYDGVKVVIDPFSMPYVNGAELDYVVDFMGGGFTIRNPNAMGSCGCGGAC